MSLRHFHTRLVWNSQNAKCFLERYDRRMTKHKTNLSATCPWTWMREAPTVELIKVLAPHGTEEVEEQKVWQKIKRPRTKRFFSAWCWVMLWLRFFIADTVRFSRWRQRELAIFISFYCSLMWHGKLARTASARNFEENLREVFFRLSSTSSGFARTVSINYLTISSRLHRNAFLFSSTYSRLLAEALIYCFILIYGENSLPASSFSLFLG